MKRSISVYLSVLLVLGIARCSDPTADLPAAEVSAPDIEEPESEPAATAPEDVQTAEEPEKQKYVIGRDSVIGFEGFKVTGSHVGGFADYDGTVSLAGDDLTTGEIAVQIDMTSTYSDDPGLTDKLLGPDFFDVENYPEASFHSTKIEADGDQYRVTGNLTLHGETNSIRFPATIELRGDKLIAEAEFTINRFDFGIEYPGVADDLIKEKVLILLDIEAAPEA